MSFFFFGATTPPLRQHVCIEKTLGDKRKQTQRRRASKRQTCQPASVFPTKNVAVLPNRFEKPTILATSPFRTKNRPLTLLVVATEPPLEPTSRQPIAIAVPRELPPVPTTGKRKSLAAAKA